MDAISMPFFTVFAEQLKKDRSKENHATENRLKQPQAWAMCASCLTFVAVTLPGHRPATVPNAMTEHIIVLFCRHVYSCAPATFKSCMSLPHGSDVYRDTKALQSPAPVAALERSSLSAATPAVHLGNMDVDTMLSPPTNTPLAPGAMTYQASVALNGNLADVIWAVRAVRADTHEFLADWRSDFTCACSRSVQAS